MRKAVRVAMHRQTRRRIKREWNKLKCFTVYLFEPTKTVLDDIPFTVWDRIVKAGDDNLLRFNLSMFKRWRAYVYYVDDGIPVNLGFVYAGVASDEWFNKRFCESDADFEH